MDSLKNYHELEGWIPFRLYFDKSLPMVDWCYLGEKSFSDPFFNQTVDACLHRPFSLLFRHQTQIETLVALSRESPGLYPSGFIFHLSRCGSTLVAQMLAALAGSIVISEAPPIDFAIRAQPAGGPIGIEQRVQWLRGLASVFGQKRIGNESHYFIKFDAWHMLDFPLIRQSFPDVPWIFLYRDPIEVLVSQIQQPSAYLLPGLADGLGPPRDDAHLTLNLAEHVASTLATIGEAALTHSGTGGRLINYQQLPGVVSDSLLEFFDVSCSLADLGKIERAALRHAKNPSLPFARDSQEKQAKATSDIRAASGKWLDSVYERLEAARIRLSSSNGAAQTGNAPFQDAVTQKIARFLREIGLDAMSTTITVETFLPGILVARGKLLIDETKLLWPGDLLHEAGHLAVAPADLRATLSGEVILPDLNLDALESQAIAWSYAASVHLGLDPKIVFHDGGYRGQAQMLRQNFELGVPLGVNGLAEAGMTLAHAAGREDHRPYPHMLKWLRD